MDASVVVVSHGRPKWLARCLRALRQLVHPTFEIVVVADTASLRQVDVSGTKATAFDVANISKARNLGLSQSAGQMLAFIDDDAVPEPLWLKHLEQAFEDTGADAVVGYVRGRNGISFQSRVSSVDIEAETHEQPAPSNTPFIPTLPNGQALIDAALAVE